MKKTSWLESFTRRSFLPEHESMPANAVDLAWTRAQELVMDAARCIRRLHGERWHPYCFYPELKIRPGDCPACDIIMHLERFVQEQVHIHVSGVVIDFLHEPRHTDQLKVAVQFYAWSIFHQCKHSQLVREPEELFSYTDYRLGDVYGESFAHKPMRGESGETPHPDETSEDELQLLVQIFTETYAHQVKQFDTWQTTHPGFTVAAFPIPQGRQPRTRPCTLLASFLDPQERLRAKSARQPV